MKLGYLLELILALAVGLALAQGWTEAEWVARLKTLDLLIWLCSNPAYTLFSGVILVEAVALWIESARGRGPRPWGFGRMTWSTLGVVCLGSWSRLIVSALIGQRLPRWGGSKPFLTLARDFSTHPAEYLAWVPLAVFLTARLAALPRDPRPDGREWAGRIFGFIIFIDYLFFQVYRLYDSGALQTLWKR
jgi:hypothetical protein